MPQNTSAVFRVELQMRIRPEADGEFERVWQEVGDSVTSHPANLGQWLARSTTEPDLYYIVSDWLDEQSFRAFESSQRHVEHRRKLHPFRTSGSMVTARVVAYLPPSAAVATHGEWEAAS